MGDTQTRVSSADLRANGDFPTRATGKVMQFEWVIAEDTTWDYLKGFGLDARKGGRL